MGKLGVSGNGGGIEKTKSDSLHKNKLWLEKKGETSVDNFGILCNVGKVGF